jgi:hypothetical protein
MSQRQRHFCRGNSTRLAGHLLCKHAFISPKSLNRRLFTVQNPLLVGLPIGLQKVNALCTSLGKPPEKCIRVEQALYWKNDLSLSFSWRDSLAKLFGPWSDERVKE